MNNQKKNYLFITQIFSILLFVSSCSNFNKEENKTQLTDNQIYSKALVSLQG